MFCFFFFCRMGKNMKKGCQLWAFIEGLHGNIIRPTEIEIVQIIEGHQPRRPRSSVTLSNEAKLEEAEAKLTSGEYSPLEFVGKMGYQFAKVKIPLPASDDDDDDDDDEVANNPNQNEEEVDLELLCKVCLSVPLTHMFLPCFHWCTCQPCGDRLLNTTRKCPICRRDLTHCARPIRS